VVCNQLERILDCLRTTNAKVDSAFDAEPFLYTLSQGTTQLDTFSVHELTGQTWESMQLPFDNCSMQWILVPEVCCTIEHLEVKILFTLLVEQKGALSPNKIFFVLPLSRNIPLGAVRLIETGKTWFLHDNC